MLDLYSKASMPHLIDTTILLQVDDLHDTHIIRNLAVVLEELSAYNVTLLRVPATSATGVMTARARIQEMYNNQAFYLQIDCHIRFRRNFDVYLISTLLGMGDKTILSTYPHAYTLSHSRAVIPDDIRPTIIVRIVVLYSNVSDVHRYPVISTRMAFFAKKLNCSPRQQLHYFPLIYGRLAFRSAKAL